MTSAEQLEALAEAIVFAHEPDVSAPAASAAAAEFERIAAMATAAMARTEVVPDHLRARLAAAGLEFCSERRAAQHPLRALDRAEPEGPSRSGGPGGFVTFLLGVAAVAVVWVGVEFSQAAPTAIPVIEQRSALLSDPTVTKIEWKAGPSPLSGQVEGDVVWSDERQKGFLTFKGLPPLDSEHRFQLWIVDGERPGSKPVDGGLFALDDAKTEAVVEVQPHLQIGKAAAFVVTVEKKDGVVVSGQEHVVAVAGL